MGFREWHEADEINEVWQRFLRRINDERTEVIFSVSELTQRIKYLLEGDALLQGIWVRGEVSNWRTSQSGHGYFTLKDEHSQIDCVIWRERLQRMVFKPTDGDFVRVFGSIRVYAKSGRYQLDVQRVEREGLGEWFLRLEELRRKLAAEGLFEPSKKRPLPKFPERIGVITSRDSAVIRDIIRIVRQRNAGVEIVLFPSQVQGEEAPPQLVRAIQLANSQRVTQLVGKLDVLIIGRGGGSIEDLWAFNDESVIRAVAASRIPIVSAVGHEVDRTLTDDAADLRAATPSGAAEQVVPDRRELMAQMRHLAKRLDNSFQNILRRSTMTLSRLLERPCFRDPLSLFSEQRQFLDTLSFRLNSAGRQYISVKRQQFMHWHAELSRLSPMAQWLRWLERLGDLEHRLADVMNAHQQQWRESLQRLSEKLTIVMERRLQRWQQALQLHETHLQALSPYAVLERGYALVRDQQTKKVLTRAAMVTEGQMAEILLTDGKLEAQITKVVMNDEPTTV